MADPAPYRKPPAPPTQASVSDAEHWNDVVDRSIDEVRTSAGKWRDGLAAVVAVITGALVIGGPTALKDLTPAFRWLVGGFLGVGYAATCVGLLLALRAAAGAPRVAEYREVIHTFLNVRAAQVAAAKHDAGLITAARRFVYAAVVLIWAGLVLWWAAPSAVKQPPAYLKVELAVGTACGKLLSGDQQMVILQVDGEREARRVPLSEVRNLRIVPSCG
ncbi:hypothetical protein [Kribbella endophytica]